MLESIRVRRRQCKAPPLLEELSKFLSRDGAPCVPIGVDAAPLRRIRRQELSKFLSGDGAMRVRSEHVGESAKCERGLLFGGKSVA